MEDIVRMDQYQYLGNCSPTPPLTQQQSIDNKSRLMLSQRRGRWAVAQILILIRKNQGKVKGKVWPLQLTCILFPY